MAKAILLALFLTHTVKAQNVASVGGFTSLSESVLKRGADALVPRLVKDIKDLVIPGVNKSFFEIDPIHFEDVSIGSYDVSVIPDTGVKVTLKDMSNVIAHTNIKVDVKLLKCTGQIWAKAAGASYTAMNTIVVDSDGKGKLHTVTPEGGFDAGAIEVHHKMNGFFCEAAADALHLLDAALIDILKKALNQHLAGIIAKIVDTPANFFIHEIEQPPALGLGKEKFYLDNSYVDVSYDNHRITHLHKSEFKSKLHPSESPLEPPPMAASSDRDVQFGFSDYVMNTLFDALNAEHIGEMTIKVPLVKTIFDKQCPKCPIALKTTFNSPARQTFVDGIAEAHVNRFTLDIGAVNNNSQVLPMVTLSVNASAGLTFSLDQTSKWTVQAALSLGSFEQELLVSHIGKIDMSDLSRDVGTLLKHVFTTLNTHIPPLPLPSIAGVKLGRPIFSIGKRALLLEADLVMPADTTPIIVV
jgi:hypothetical protein